jgi:BASS family bile acid:Na+ symporter
MTAGIFVIRLSLVLAVIALSLTTRPRDVTYLLRHPLLLIRSFVAMNVVMPLVALWFAIVFALSPAVKLALITLSISPIPPLLPGKALRSGGGHAYTVALLTTMSALSIGVIPLTMKFLGALFDLPLEVESSTIASIVASGILLPVVVGIAIRQVAPRLADKIARPAGSIAKLLLVGGLIPLLMATRPSIRAVIDDGTLLAIVGITVIGLAVGHLFAGRSAEDRPVLALATASRHPAIAIAIASAVFPNEQLVGAAVFTSVLVGAITTIPYVKLSQYALQSRAGLARRSSDRTNAPPASRRHA